MIFPIIVGRTLGDGEKGVLLKWYGWLPPSADNDEDKEEDADSLGSKE